MNANSLVYLRCPSCYGRLEQIIEEASGEQLIRGALSCPACRQTYPVDNGLPQLLFPPQPEGADSSAHAFYDSRPAYDYRLTAFRFGIWSITFGNARRLGREWPARLELSEGGAVLETGIGTGNSLPYLSEAVGKRGRLHGLDMSAPTLSIARQRAEARGIQAELVQGNASYLPYRDEAFDGVLHMGGFNGFGEKKRAVDEMHRVAKPGGKIVFMDEGLAPGREKTLLGRYILRCMPLFASKPPLDLLPRGAAELKIYCIYQGTFWVIEYRKA